MTKNEARKLYAHFDAAWRLSMIVPMAAALLLIFSGADLPTVVLMSGACVSFMAMVAAVSVDTISKRIPNGLSVLPLIGALLWWAGILMGASVSPQADLGVINTLSGWLLGTPEHGAFLPDIASVGYPWRIALDLAMGVVVFIPAFLSFIFRLGFGGGDVKLMTALAVFFGWPLGMDFFLLTFLIGMVPSVAVIAVNYPARLARHLGHDTPRIRKLARLRELPFAPAIGLAAIICFAIKGVV